MYIYIYILDYLATGSPTSVYTHGYIAQTLVDHAAK